LSLTVLAFNFLGDGLRDALDPWMERWNLAGSTGGLSSRFTLLDNHDIQAATSMP
jgi:hypothetical protein